MEPMVIRKEIEIEAPAERVWPFVATREGGLRWLCNVAEVHELVLEPRVADGSRSGRSSAGREYAHIGEVVAYDPPRLVIPWREAGAIGTVTWRLEPEGAGGRSTRLHLVHEGLGAVPGILRDHNIAGGNS